MPSAHGGFFCDDLAADPFLGGASFASFAGELRAQGAPLALGADADELAATVAHAQSSFASSGRSQPRHALIPGALDERPARALERDLERTPVVAHPHAHYPLRVAPAATQPPALARFTAWLRTPAAARLHMKLVGFEHDRPLTQIQVQTSRMERGERFPAHVDTDAEGLACIYHLSRLRPGDGGELVFVDRLGDDRAPTLAIAPLFGSLLVFEPRGAPHEVQPVRGPRARFSVTAFYLVS